MSVIQIRNAKLTDLEAIVEIEHQNFSLEERASQAALEERIKTIPDSFLVVELNQSIVAYIVGPVVEEQRLDDSLFEKVLKNPERGGYITILSLSVAPAYQDQGLGTALLAAMKDLAIARSSKGISLTCHEELIPYYEMNGFKEIGVSESTHGNVTWYDMLWLSEWPS